MNSISRVYGLIHPDYHAMYDKNPELGLHSLQAKLRASWEERAQLIKTEPSSALFYVSVLDKKELTKGFERPSNLGNLVKEQDIERIKRWQGLLEERFFLFPNRVLITSDMIEREATDKRVVFDRDKIELRVFGEYEGGGITCVESWGRGLKKELGVPDSKYHIERELSFHVDEIGTVNDWRKFRRGKEF